MGGDTSPEQQYALRWNDFQSSILSSFRHLRDEEDFVDVTLACDGCSFTAHKVVLSACSPYFRRLLKANPCQHPIVILRDVQQKDMENLLRFMYNGEVHIGQEQLADFLKTAQMLQVRGLADVPAGSAGQKLTVPEQKVSPNSTSLPPWTTDRSDELREGGLTPPPSKRSRSTENNRDIYTPERGRSPSRGNGDMQESLLEQALEVGPALRTNTKGNSDTSLQAQSTGEDSSSDTQMSDHERENVTPKTEPSDYPVMDDHHSYNNGGLMDQARTPFPGALLNLPGLPGLIPGPSSMPGGADHFGDASRGRRNTAPSKPEMPPQGVSVKYECPLCDQVLPSINAARVHIDEHYPRDSPYCPVTECGKRFTHPNSVRNHMRTKHSRQWEIMKQMKWSL